MNDRATIVLGLLLAVVIGAAIYSLGTRQGSKQALDGFQTAWRFLPDSHDGNVPPTELPEPEPKRPIGFGRG